MRNAVFLSTGLGNALLLVPLLKALESKGEVIAFCNSPYFPEEVFAGLENPPVHRLVLLRHPRQIAREALRFAGKIDGMYLDHFSSTPKILAFSTLVAKRTFCVTTPKNLLKKRSITCIPPVENDHEAARYLKLARPEFDSGAPDESLFALNAKGSGDFHPPGEKYFTLQPGSGSNAAPWKNLPAETWAEVGARLLEAEPDANLILLGENSEAALGDAFPHDPRIHRAFGSIPLRELPRWIAGAELHLGGDSFLMHLAGCLGTPTFTVWGGSDPNMYGWNRIAPHRHAMAYASPPCGPCSRWLNPNTSRVSNPAKCPDFRCLRGFSARALFEDIVRFRTSLRDD